MNWLTVAYFHFIAKREFCLCDDDNDSINERRFSLQLNILYCIKNKLNFISAGETCRKVTTWEIQARNGSSYESGSWGSKG